MSSVVHCKREKYDVYIGRPSKFGNPIRLLHESDRKDILRQYRDWLGGYPPLVAMYGTPPTKEEIKAELRGKVLGCWCSPRACHGDILLEIANSAP